MLTKKETYEAIFNAVERVAGVGRDVLLTHDGDRGKALYKYALSKLFRNTVFFPTNREIAKMMKYKNPSSVGNNMIMHNNLYGLDKEYTEIYNRCKSEFERIFEFINN